ncbi:hypothetical protein [Arthrobacter methylotrophus]
MRFTTPIAVDPTAPAGTTFTDGEFNMTNSLKNSTGSEISGGRTGLQYKTPAAAAIPVAADPMAADPVAAVPVAAVPVVDPIVGLGAGVVIAGAGAAVALNRRRRVVAAS